MFKERIRLGETLTLPSRWQESLHATDGDELTVLCRDDSIVIVKDMTCLDESFRAFLEQVSSPQDEYMARVARLAAEYDTCAMAQLAAEYDGPRGPMSPELEALYLEAEREVHESHLPPLREGMIVEFPPEFVEQFRKKS